jgi:hypothetical protein
VIYCRIVRVQLREPDASAMLTSLNWPRGLILVVCVLLLQIQRTWQWSSSMSTLSDRLLFQYRTDPLATVDECYVLFYLA